MEAALDDLPDHLLLVVLDMCWRARPRRRPAGAEVRHALQLAAVCRRFRRLLQAQPPPLDLDFSDALLGRGHLAWLALPALANRVASLMLHGWKEHGCQGCGGILEEDAHAGTDEVTELLRVLAGNQLGSLVRLLGVPVHPRGGEPRLDLSAFALTELGMTSCSKLPFPAQAALPPSLVSFASRWHGSAISGTKKFAGSQVAPAGMHPECLPQLSRLVLKGYKCLVGMRSFPGGEHVLVSMDTPVDLRALPEEVHDARGVFRGYARAELYPRAKTVLLRVHALSLSFVLVGVPPEESVDSIAGMLCPESLEAALIVTQHGVPLVTCSAAGSLVPGLGWRRVLRALIAARAGAFAFEAADCGRGVRAGWRRWPPRGTPAWEAAARAHAEAVVWASF